MPVGITIRQIIFVTFLVIFPQSGVGIISLTLFSAGTDEFTGHNQILLGINKIEGLLKIHYIKR